MKTPEDWLWGWEAEYWDSILHEFGPGAYIEARWASASTELERKWQYEAHLQELRDSVSVDVLHQHGGG